MSENVSDERDLTPKQQELISALLSLPTLTAAAQSANVNYRTAYRWQKLPHFQKAYKAAKQEKFNDALDLLQTGISTAIKTLLKNMTSEDAPAAVQVRAAQIWLEQAVELHKVADLEQQVAELQEIVMERKR